jgi:acyl-CoA synthetase (AMP-forming)/AMP-acid ligase II
MNISELLARNARKYSLQEAVVALNERLTYQELNNRVNKLANTLKQKGFGRGDKVILFMPNTPEFIISYFAVLRIEGIIVPVNAKLTESELSYIIDHSDAKAIFVHDLLFEPIKQLTEKFSIVFVKTGEGKQGWESFETLLELGSDEEIICHQKEDDESTMLYTSGTTGSPKGVLFTNRNILTVAVMMASEMAMKPESKMLHLMPLSHSAPLHLFLVAGTYVGATHIVAPTFTPELLLKLVHEEKATHFFGAPVAYLLTAKHPKLQEFDLSSMKYWVYGGAPQGQNEVQIVKKSFKTDNLYCVYGLTEAGPSGTLLLAEEHDTKAGSIGKRAALNTEISILTEKGEVVETGEVGEIVLKGEGIMKGYYKDEKQTEEVLKNGWLYTGDMAKYDEDGYIWVVDRKKDMIISGGVNVYPKEIEELLAAHPKIAEVAVVGVPNPEWGETVKAFVVLNDSMEDLTGECTDFLTNKLASFKIPKLYEQVDQLPRNATGKILKQVLRNR